MPDNKCPDCGNEMTSARYKDAEFSDGDNDIMVTLYLYWCPDCKYIDYIETN